MGGAGFLFVQKGIWVKAFYPALALLAPLGLIVALRLTASEKETRDVGAEKLENQKLLGLSFQEKGMLDMALATFNKLPFTEDMKLVYLHLGLDYENRGLPQKAFLVYKKDLRRGPPVRGRGPAHGAPQPGRGFRQPVRGPDRPRGQVVPTPVRMAPTTESSPGRPGGDARPARPR